MHIGRRILFAQLFAEDASDAAGGFSGVNRDGMYRGAVLFPVHLVLSGVLPDKWDYNQKEKYEKNFNCHKI